MSADTTFQRILARLDDSDAEQEKTASAEPTPSPEENLVAQIQSLSTEKVASVAQSSPLTDLEKIAQNAHAAEQAHLTKEAQHLGAAIADGFMARYAQYDSALEQSGVKTAAVADPAQLQKAAEHGYTQAVQDMEKQAAASYEQGYNDQMHAVHKIASELHYAGQGVANQIVTKYRTQD